MHAPAPNYPIGYAADVGKRVVIYARVSRDDSGEGRSVDRQVEACRKLCDMRGWEVVAVERDISISAWSGKERPAWKQVLGLVETGEVDVVVAWHIDRMTRSILDLEQLILLSEAHGVGIATVTGDIDLTTDVGRMVARILAAVARAEVERKASRQKLANAQRAREGVPHTGGVRPFGYEQDGRTIVPAEAEAIREAAQMFLRGGATIGSIARDWTAKGLHSARSERWSTQGVRELLMNPRYAALRYYNGEEIGTGDWPAILDHETHLALKAALLDPKRRLGTVTQGPTPSNLLTGIATCSVCGVTVYASRARGRDLYICKAKRHTQAPREIADAYVESAVVAMLSTPGLLAELAPTGDDTVDEAKREVESIRTRLDELAAAYAADAIDIGVLTSASKTLRERLGEAERVIAQAASGTALVGLRVGSDEVIAQWEALPLARKRAIVQTLMQISLLPGKRPRVPYDPRELMTVDLIRA